MAKFKKKFRRSKGAVSQKTAKYNREIVLKFDERFCRRCFLWDSSLALTGITKSFKLEIRSGRCCFLFIFIFLQAILEF
jgi:hypothetical protein